MRLAFLPLLFLLAPACAAAAEPRTVCTITVNSDDEKEAFRRGLPKDGYRFVELVEKGRPDWLASACAKKVQCDALIVSGHFNAGDVFYSDRLASDEYLRVDELERASCSDSCPGLFSHLKEVYLFGCESLNPDASKYSSSHGDSGEGRMRRIFAGVPLLYGFPASAPLGPAAASLLDRHFAAGPAEIGSGRRSARLLGLFARSGMSATRGAAESQAERREVCGFFDGRLTPGRKLAAIHAAMRRDLPQAIGRVARIEGLLASLTDAERQAGDFLLALAEVSADDAIRDRYLAAARAVEQPAVRARMIALATTLGWLSPEARATETLALVNDLLAGRSLGFPEVEAICSLNAAGGLDRELARLRIPAARIEGAGAAAASACLGDEAARLRVLAAVASADEGDVRVAQVYLRHRPEAAPGELQAMAHGIARMPGGAAQVRALDTLGRLRIADREVVDELARSFAATKSLDVQQAIAEVFLRADAPTVASADLPPILRRHRLASRGGEDLIDLLIRRLTAARIAQASAR